MTFNLTYEKTVEDYKRFENELVVQELEQKKLAAKTNELERQIRTIGQQNYDLGEERVRNNLMGKLQHLSQETLRLADTCTYLEQKYLSKHEQNDKETKQNHMLVINKAMNVVLFQMIELEQGIQIVEKEMQSFISRLPY